MNKNLIKFKILLVTIFILLQNIAMADNLTVFRNIKWGYSIQKVIESELPNQRYKIGNDFISYKEKMADRECIIRYNFTNNDKLYRVFVIFSIKDKYDRNKFLKYMYGIFKDNNKYKEKEGSGVFSNVFSFENEVTDVGLLATKDDVSIIYTDKLYADKEKNEEIEKFNNTLKDMKQKRDKHLKEF